MPEDEREELAEAFLAASRALVGIAIRGLGSVASDVTIAQHRVLLLLHDHGELSVNDIADLLGVNQSNASRHAGRLTELGLVSREQAAHDGRAVALRLTPEGRARVDAVRRRRLEEIRAVLTRMDVAEAHVVAAALREFEAAAEVPIGHDVGAVVH